MDSGQINRPRNWKDTFRALSLLGLLWAVVSMALFFDVFVPSKVVNFLANSTYPRLALFVAGGVVSNAAIILLRGADISIGGMLGKVLGSPKLRVYWVALPLGVNFALLTVLSILLFWTVPFCQTPAGVRFIVNENPYVAGATVEAKTDQILTVVAKPIEQDVSLNCQWQMAGESFNTLNRKPGCEVTINTSLQPGQGVLTLIATQRFCSTRAYFPLIIQVSDDGQ